MKNILKYGAFAAIAASMMACEQIPDYVTTIDAAPGLAFVDRKDGNTFSTLVVHRPEASEGSFYTEFVINANTTRHPETEVSVDYDASLVDGYNKEHGTSYMALPAEYLAIENGHTVIPANATVSRDTVKLSLSEDADISLLTEKGYLAPLAVRSSELGESEQMGPLWFIVNTEKNILRPIESAEDIAGFLAGGTSEWSADCNSPANLFDGNASTSVSFSEETNVLTVDMLESRMVTGLKLNARSIRTLSLEYSEDGKVWEQAGTISDGYYVYSGNDLYLAVYDYIKARYLRLSFNSTEMSSLDVYVIESDEPTVYTVTGNDNVVTAKIVHRKGYGSSSDLNASFKVYTTILSDKGYKVTVAVDNSLVDEYNAKYGTAYKELPSENLEISNASLEIAAGENASDKDVTVSLKGDLSGLTATEGYLVPIKLSSADAETSASRGVVYAVIATEHNMIKPIRSESEVLGYPTGSRSSWSSDAEGSKSLFDGNNSTSIRLGDNNVITVNMGRKYMMTGLRLHANQISGLQIEYSGNGSDWTSAGTVADGEAVSSASSWNTGDYIVAFTEAIECSHIRLSFGFSGYSRNMAEISIYETESTGPVVYTVCGQDNMFTGGILHNIYADSKAELDASFNVMTTVASASGYSVGVSVDNSLVNGYNAAHGTSYGQVEPSMVELAGAPCEIGAGEVRSEGTVSVRLTGDLSSLRNTAGYVIPLRLEAAGAVTSSSRGVVYVVMTVTESDSPFMTGFAVSDIVGAPVADRSGWKIVTCDKEGIHSGSYENLFDGDPNTYIRTWGGPVSFTVDLGQEYDMTGLVISSRPDQVYLASTIQVMTSADGAKFTNVGTAVQAEGSVLHSRPSAFVGFYVPQKVRFLKIEASYGSNMGQGEFNIYVK